MATSRVYYYRQFPENFVRTRFGDYQSGFNFNLVLDETKDSCKVTVLTMNDTILAPNTIVRLEGISTWWCVKKDTRNRLMNESGYLYEHTLELQGAFEILNSRDLINCGFNVEHYTTHTFLERLVSLCDYEIPITFDYGNVLSNKTVNFLKTFENYTPASAIKEFLNGYNCIPKMTFEQNSSNQIIGAIIKIYSKSGLTETPLSEDVFNDISAIDNIDRESYASKVTSNIQNCVARHSVKFPRMGGTYLVGQNGQITYEKASMSKIILPSKIYAVESITIYGSILISIGDNPLDKFVMTPDDLTRNGYKTRGAIYNRLLAKGYSQNLANTFYSYWGSIFERLKPLGCQTLYNGGYYDAINGVPYGNYLVIANRGSATDLKLYLNNERYAYSNDGEYNWVISWKQGSNEIVGLGEALEHAQKTPTNYFRSNFINDGTVISVEYEQEEFYIRVGANNDGNFLNLIDYKEETGGGGDIWFPHLLVSVNYVPMSDIKFKTDNSLVGNDTKLYNQNGKLVDSYAVSKLVNSYCKSIRDKDMVRFGTYYSISDIPKLGARVGDYVINNISYDVYDNDNGGFVYKCQFGLNLYSICKSTMINANTNIRDYDCPQTNNIKRIQTYRDYVEISYTRETSETTYLNKSKIIHIGTDYIGINDDLVFVMKATDNSFDNEGDSHSHNYYYHLDHISFDLSKQKKFVVDFADNNIIGYGNAFAYKPFAFSNLLDNARAVTVPISYVSPNGEVSGLELLACLESEAEYNFGATYISESVAIKNTIYNNFNDNYVLKISEPNYNKDGLEIPVFEYSCEIGGDGNIEIADDFFEYGENYDGFVAIKFDFPINSENAGFRTQGISYNASIYFDNYEMQITLSGELPQSAKGHWGIYAKKGTTYRFLFALNNYPSEFYDSDTLIAYFNYYCLK